MAPEDTSYGFTPIFGSLVGWGHLSGPSVNAVRTMIVGITGASCAGTFCGIFFAPLIGAGAVPFLAGASFGFVGAIWGYYRFCITRALADLNKNPRLLQLHLQSSFPTEKWSMQRLQRIARDDRGIVETSQLVLSWQSASRALEEIHTQRENAIINESVEAARSTSSQLLLDGE